MPLLVFFAMLLAGCGDDARQATRDLPPPDLNVLLIVVDTLGARHLGCHTPGLTNSPNIDRLAAAGVQFRRAYSVTSWTQPAVASLFTSRMPSQHGVRHIFDQLDRRERTLAERLKDRGLSTGGVISHFIIGDEFGYGQGFDTYDDEAVGNHRSVTSHTVTDLAMARLDQLAGEPFFLFVHYFDPHWYYNHHPDFDQTSDYEGQLLPGMEIGVLRAMRNEMSPEDVAYLTGLYREEIAYTDHHIGRLLDHLRKLGLAENTVVVLTADHGEEFMEHGWIGHTATLHEELIHVPLIVHLPSRWTPRIVDEPVSILDVAPTIVDLLGLDPAAGEMIGRSLQPALEGTAGEPAPPLFAELSYISPSGWPSGDGGVQRYYQTALIEGNHKHIHDLVDGTWEFYDLLADPGEQDNLFDADDPALRGSLNRLHAWEVDHTATWQDELREELEIDPEAARRLRALGYVH